MFCGIHLRAISQREPKMLFCIMSLKIILLKILPHLPGTNELSIYVHLPFGHVISKIYMPCKIFTCPDNILCTSWAYVYSCENKYVHRLKTLAQSGRTLLDFIWPWITSICPGQGGHAFMSSPESCVLLSGLTTLVPHASFHSTKETGPIYV